MSYNSWAKFSFLPRNSELDPEKFSLHYLEYHGPLAANQAGFRKFTERYEQNHVLQTLSQYRLLMDGITKTWQLPRDDYSLGFFSEPDYVNVQADEHYMFDTSKVVSLLADTEESYRSDDDARHGAKVLGIVYTPVAREDLRSELEQTAASYHSLSRIEPSLASALGYGAIEFDGTWIIEAWFADSEVAQRAAARLSAFLDTKLDLWLVKNHVIYSSPEEWVTQSTQR